MRISYLYNKFLKKYKFIVVILWIIIFSFSIWLGPKFLSNTKLVFDPPEDSPSALAEEIFVSEFPDRESESNIILLIKSKKGENIINQEINNTITSLVSSLKEFEYYEVIESVQDYFTLSKFGYSDLANQLISNDGQSLITIIEYLNASRKEIRALQEFIENKINDSGLSTEKYYVGITGSDILILDIETGTKHDLARMDSIVLPIALLVLALVLQSFRLMIIPLFTMGISSLTSFLIMLPISKVMDVVSFAPSVMMSCVIAMSIDYSLFLLTRYREEIIKGKDVETSVALMSEHAGHTIMVSGLTLAVCFMGLVFFPMDLLQSIGLGASIAVLSTIAVNLTLTPSLLLIFKKFFREFSLAKKIRRRRMEEKESKTEEDIKKIELEKQLKSFWYKVSKFSTKYSAIIILVIFIIAVPISVQVFKLEHTVDTNQVFPRNLESVETYNILLDEFDPGVIFPYYIIIQGPAENTVLNQSFFNYAQKLIDTINSSLGIPYENILSIFTQPNGLPIPYIYAIQFLDENSSLYYSNEALLYRIAFQQYVNPSNSSAVIQINTPFDPFASEEFVKETRDVMNSFQENNSNSDYNLYLAGGICTIVDSIDKVYELFPVMIIITIIIVYALISVMFRSVFVPLRLLITIGLTLSWIYGLAVLVFEMNIFDKLFPALQSVDAMYWITPIMAFSILVGLGLDYDIFLLSRISEYRRKGYTEEAAIHKGVYRTGSIISAAGIIMAIAFSGLMLSKEMVLNQFGFMLCFAVLVDTFIIRTILVPAIMSLAKKWNWWPSKLPNESKDDLFFEDEF